MGVIGGVMMLLTPRQYADYPQEIHAMSTPGAEPGLSRPRRDGLTTRRCGLLHPIAYCRLMERCQISTQLHIGALSSRLIGPPARLQPTTPRAMGKCSADSAREAHASSNTRGHTRRGAPEEQLCLWQGVGGPWQSRELSPGCSQPVPWLSKQS